MKKLVFIICLFSFLTSFSQEANEILKKSEEDDKNHSSQME